MSGKVVVNRAMSLDGFVAGPGDTQEWIFDFMVPVPSWQVPTGGTAPCSRRRTAR